MTAGRPLSKQARPGASCESGDRMKVRDRRDHLQVEFDNGVSVEVRKAGRLYGGIGQVRCGRRDLRCPDLPILPVVHTEDGYRLAHLELDNVRQGRDELTISMRPYMTLCGHMQERAGDGEPLWNVGPWTNGPVRDRGGALWLCLREVNYYFDGLELRGFSYGYRLRSRRHRASRIHDCSTWELGGRATGNTLVMRGHPQSPCKAFRNKSATFTTARVQDGVVAGQFLPLFTELQGFTFQFDRRGILVTAFEKPFPCLSLVQKDRGRNCLVHWHQLCGVPARKGTCLSFPSLEVMFADVRARGEAERLNQYEVLRQDIYERYAKACGLQEELASCAGGFVRGGCQSRADIERCLKTLARAECAEVMVTDLLAPAEAGAQDKEAEGRAGPAPSAAQADRKRISDIASVARRYRMEVAGSLSPLLHRGAERGPLPPGGSAAPVCSVCGDHARIASLLDDVRKKFSLDAVYLNGLPGAEDAPAARLCAECAPHKQFAATLAFHRLGQQRGFRCAMGGGGPLGLTCWQIPYSAIRNRELLYRDSVMPFPYKEVVEVEKDTHLAYFRGYASRLCYWVGFRGGQAAGGLEEWWDARYAAINKAYNAVHDHMAAPWLLDGESGVVWFGPEGEEDVNVLWAYREVAWEVGPEAAVYDVMAGRSLAIRGDEFTARPLRVYLVQGARPL